MKIEMWPIDRPRPYNRNPRVLKDKAIAKVVASIREFGFRQPLVVDRHDVIIIGHKRLLAAKKLKLTEIPVIIADDLPPAKVKALRIADNRSADEGEWAEDLLGDELADLKDLGLSLDLTGFDPDELDELMSLDDAPGAGADAAELASEEETVVSRPGDQWRLGQHTLLVGDPADRKIDLTIKRWMYYTGEAAKLGNNGKTFREVAADRLHDHGHARQMGSKTAPAPRLAKRPTKKANNPPRAA